MVDPEEKLPWTWWGRDELESRITAYKKDIISLGRECGKEWERAEAAEAKVKELEAVVRSLQKELKRSAEAGMRVMDQRTTAIRERDDARKALEEIDEICEPHTADSNIARLVHDIARDASSNREGGE